MGGEDLGQLGAAHRLAPHADGFADDLDVGILGEDFLRGRGALRVDRGAWHAGQDDDVALAVRASSTSHSAVTRPASAWSIWTL